MAAAAFTTQWNGGKGEMRTQWECTGAIEQLSWGAWLGPPGADPLGAAVR